MQVTEAEKKFAELVDEVYLHGVSIDLERDARVVARLTPAVPHSPLGIGGLNDFLSGLPPLGDDAESFAADVRTIRGEFPAESISWE